MFTNFENEIYKNVYTTNSINSVELVEYYF